MLKRRIHARTLLLFVMLAPLLLSGCGRARQASDPTPSVEVVGSVDLLTATVAAVVTATPMAVVQATITSTAPISVTLTPTASVTPPPTACPPPAEWSGYTVRPGETLSHLAAQSGTTIAALQEANCLDGVTIYVGQELYLPVEIEPPALGCQIPAGWVKETVRFGDTVSELAAAAGTTTEAVLEANCLDSPDIVEGDMLFLPSAPTRPSAAVASSRTSSSAAQPSAGSLDDSSASSGADAAGAASAIDAGSAQSSAQAVAPAADDTAVDAATDGDGGRVIPRPRSTSPFTTKRGPGPEIHSGDPNPGSRFCPISADAPFQIRPHGGLPELEIGQRVYLYACNPANREEITATVTAAGTDYFRILPVADHPPNPSFLATNDFPTAVWAALPGPQPAQSYQIVMEDSSEIQTAPLTITHIPPTEMRILVDPHTGSRGTSFTVYVVNVDPGTATLELLSSDSIEFCATGESSKRDPIEVEVDRAADGYYWGSVTLQSLPTDPMGCYEFRLGDSESKILLQP